MIGYTLVSTEVVVGDDVVVRDGATHIAARLTQIPFPTDAMATST